MFTGSGFPQRFADLDGSLIDVYQATTQITDESGQTIPTHIAALLDRALGAEGYYGVFTANMHTDQADHAGRQRDRGGGASRAACRSSPPARCSRWLDGRNASSFGGMSFANGRAALSVIAPGAGRARPRGDGPGAARRGGTLSGLTRGGQAVSDDDADGQGRRVRRVRRGGRRLRRDLPRRHRPAGDLRRGGHRARRRHRDGDLDDRRAGDSQVRYGTSAGSLTGDVERSRAGRPTTA